MSSGRRQRIEKVAGARRAKLTPAPGTVPEPGADEPTDAGPSETPDPAGEASGPNDERLRRDIPPHY